ncbi:transcriptional regulator [Acinetobacter baylyi]|nr:hypothetical protein F952_01978 [Acinetobacter baylyi DSM 14961 = CIP 107474]KAF2373387.1 transcriptional regulator [Acinetobacter baylyi]KAF2374541.1 transcriptional regulator [Acinetobacter baylyi]KAF2377223.1 transcriptional regulator [Acinetobacter baylyi]KAF2381219.1 transcriptional regulator [Acinetobacter baylyi]
MKTLAERLKYAMEILPPKKIKGVELARVVGVKPPSVSDWLSGKSRSMEGENLLRAAKFLDVNPVWLATGTGKPKTTTEDGSNLFLIEEPNSVEIPNQDIRQLVDSLLLLDSKGRLSPELIKAIRATIDISINSLNN